MAQFICISVHVCETGDQGPGAFLSRSPSYSSSQCLSLNLKLTYLARVGGSKPAILLLLPLWCRDYRCGSQYPAFTWCWGFELSSPRLCSRYFPAKPSHHPHAPSFKKLYHLSIPVVADPPGALGSDCRMKSCLDLFSFVPALRCPLSPCLCVCRCACPCLCVCFVCLFYSILLFTLGLSMLPRQVTNSQSSCLSLISVCLAQMPPFCLEPFRVVIVRYL